MQCEWYSGVENQSVNRALKAQRVRKGSSWRPEHRYIRDISVICGKAEPVSRVTEPRKE